MLTMAFSWGEGDKGGYAGEKMEADIFTSEQVDEPELKDVGEVNQDIESESERIIPESFSHAKQSPPSLDGK